MIYNKYRVLFFLLCAILSQPVFAQQNEMDVIAHRVVDDLKGKPGKRLSPRVLKYLKALQTDGTWKDINYTDNAAAIWAPANHLSRVEDFAIAYSHQPNDELYNGIITALRGWNRLDPHCRNWWFNEISCPQSLGQILLMMRASKPLPTGLQDSLLVKMNRGDMYKQTGANKFDVALHNLYSALLTHDVTLLDSAVSQCFQPVVLTTATEGLQFDYSYLQHGPQLQVASYGTVFLEGEYKVTSYVVGTRWQMSGQKQTILTGFLDHTFLNAVRYKYFDFSVLGRGVSRVGSTNAGVISGLKSSINKLIAADPNLASAFAGYNDAVERASGKVPPSYHIKPQHNQYWIGDYTQHVTPAYLFTVRTNSGRTRRTETGNGENLLGRYLSDGATDIQRRGDEYFNIMPVWEYDKTPGVTSRDFAVDRPAVKSWDQPGTTNFTGGVSDRVYGASTYTLDFDSVKAKKAWFFFDKMVVCLGAGIRSVTAENITTTLNQCWSRGELLADEAKQAYWHDSIAYYIAPQSKVIYKNAVQSGTWRNINISQTDSLMSGKVFKLWIDHGPKPQNASYAYIVEPGVSATEFKSEKPFADVQVLSNTETIQATFCPRLDIIQAVFYQAGKLKIGSKTIEVSEPCVIMLEHLNTKVSEVFIADPSHKLNSVKVTVNGKQVEIKLPVEQYAGATVKQVF